MTGILNNSKTYLCGAMENSLNSVEWRVRVTRALEEIGIVCFDPNKQHFLNQVTEGPEDQEMLKSKRQSGDWNYIHKYMTEIIRRDLRYVDLSTFIIVNIEPDKPTYGTIHELVVASMQGKPILLHINDKARFPLWLAGLVNMDLVFDDWEKLIKYIKDIDSGTIYADPKYWKILIKEYR